MPLLTITASNKNRLKLDNDASIFFLKSIQWQGCTDFELLIADGGSDNYEELKEHFEKHNGPVKMRIVQHKIDLFSRSFLNNVGIRNAETNYIATTDVDMLFAKDFVFEVLNNIGENILLESRTMYLKKPLVNKIYAGELDPYNNINDCKRGRIKKRTSAGGFQCMHIDSWKKLHGFNEEMKVWGSEDYDLLTRAKRAKIKIKWMGESRDKSKLFHQHHSKPDVKRDLEWQEKNKKLMNNAKHYLTNPSGHWGGVKD